MDIFAEATRKGLRFQSNAGALTTEQLWDLPLTSKNGVDLDTVAKTINRKIKSTEEESFVSTNTKENKELTLSLDVVKYIIGVRLSEKESAKNYAKTQAQKAILLRALEEKRTQSINDLSEEEITKRLSELG